MAVYSDEGSSFSIMPPGKKGMLYTLRMCFAILYLLGEDLITVEELSSSKFMQQYASQWDQLAAILGLEDCHIANISKDLSSNVVECCKTMLQEWQKMCSFPTWGKLEAAVTALISKNEFPGA